MITMDNIINPMIGEFTGTYEYYIGLMALQKGGIDSIGIIEEDSMMGECFSELYKKNKEIPPMYQVFQSLIYRLEDCMRRGVVLHPEVHFFMDNRAY